MSRINKMSIQGIRSFGPEDRDVGVIQFFSPLTLILGPNGTGKTTIIECLKYITTGELPPGGKNGAAFINDPKIARETEVKAQVCLQFYDMKGELCTGKRSLVATQKKNKVEMKTLEGLIVKKLSNGEKVTISSKCAEMDREMISLLGVSKPILENVIFCHQEESNWPLSEGKALKQKFDDIFASTRYVKALDAIRKCRQDQMTLIKEYQVELKYLKQNKEKVDQINHRLIGLSERQEASNDGILKIRGKMEPVVGRLKILEEKEEEIRTISNTIAKIDGERSQMKRIVTDLRKKIKNLYSGAIEDLLEEIKEFGCKIQEKEKSLILSKEKESALEREGKSLEGEKEKVLMEKVRLEEDDKRYQGHVGARNKMIKSIVTNHEIQESINGEDGVEAIISFMKIKSESLVAETKSIKTESAESTEKLQRELDAKRSSKTKLETEQKLKEDALKKNHEELEKINNKLEMMDSCIYKLENIRFAIKDKETRLEAFKTSFDVESARSEIQKLQKEANEVDSRIRLLDLELSKFNQELTVRTQLDMLNKDKTAKEETLRRLLAKNGDNMKHILGSIPSDAFGKNIEKYIQAQSRRVRNTTESLQQLKNNLAKLETRRKIERENLLKKQEEIRGYEQKINSVTDGKDVSQGLNDLSSKLQISQDKKGHLTAMEYMFKKYIEKLRRHNPDCPLCHRPFDEQSEVEELISEMETKLNVIPERLDACQKSISDTSTDYEKWLQLNPIRGMMASCKTEDIPRIEDSIDSLGADISKLNSQISEREEELEMDSNDETMARSLSSDASQMDRLQMEINELIKKINLHSSKLSPDASGRSVEGVEDEKSSAISLKDSLCQQLEQKKELFEEHSSKLHRMQDDLHKHKTEQLSLEADLQSQSKLESNRKNLVDANANLLSEIQGAKDNIQPISVQIDKIVEEKRIAEKQSDVKVEEISKKLDQVNEDLRGIVNLQSEINKYERGKCSERLQASHENLRSAERKIRDLNERKTKLIEAIDRLKEDVSAQKVQLREFEDNKQLLEKQKEIKEFDEFIRLEEEKLGNCSVNELMQQKNSLKKEREIFDKEMDVLKTRKQKLEGEISALRDELSSESLADAEKKYRDKVISLRTTELASSDLEKYYKALDRTIMSYHNQKMSEINKIIRELWRNTYKGHDIETIEIRSDEEEGSGAAKTRRTYHYRVVMVSGGTELDMRGRCSAGQKVLASLIIRLALAETFCLNCGVLALDEPTTNLDRENIESLAFALVEIIKSRSKQKNFQLVVITHDEDFVELLGRSDYVDEFFRVKKDDTHGCSRLMKCKINNLQSK